jgi:hypothetical protein
MKSRLPLLVLAIFVPVCATRAEPPRLRDVGAQARIGHDSNPNGTDGTSAAVLGHEGTMTYAAGAGFALAWNDAAAADGIDAKIAYAGEAVRFDRVSSENHATHRFEAGVRLVAGGWKITGDGSSLFVDGERDTLAVVPSANANAVAVWRERRRQWQHRLKLQGEADYGRLVVRLGARLLAYDYQTDVEAGKVAFANRSDAQVSADAGWRQSERSLWLAGARIGHQEQATVPLPGGDFEYSNDYLRLATGWEGKPLEGATVTFVAGPDFRRYSGAVDPAVFRDRDRVSLWLEGGFVSKINDSVTVSGKAVRTAWLSSTGKSAYIDTSAEIATSWAASDALTFRVSAKAHRCDYYPAVRDDWESFLGAGASYKISPRTTLTLDVLDHRAWNDLDGVAERKFDRVVVNAGASMRF